MHAWGTIVAALFPSFRKWDVLHMAWKLLGSLWPLNTGESFGLLPFWWGWNWVSEHPTEALFFSFYFVKSSLTGWRDIIVMFDAGVWGDDVVACAVINQESQERGPKHVVRMSGYDFGDQALSLHSAVESHWVTLGQSNTLNLTCLIGLFWGSNGAEEDVSRLGSPLGRKARSIWVVPEISETRLSDYMAVWSPFLPFVPAVNDWPRISPMLHSMIF